LVLVLLAVFDASPEELSGYMNDEEGRASSTLRRCRIRRIV